MSSSTPNDAQGTASREPGADLHEDPSRAGAAGDGADDDDGLDAAAEDDFAAAAADADADLSDTDSEYEEMRVEDALGGGFEKLLALVEETPPYRADGTDFVLNLRLFPDLQNSPLITGYLKRPPVNLEESRETRLAVTVADKGRTSDGGQRQQVSLNDDPANAAMFHAICERVHCSLFKGQPARDFRLDEMLEGTDPRTRQKVTKPVRDWLPGYIKGDFIYQLLDSRFRLVDAEGNILDEGTKPEEVYFALLELRQFYVLQEIGSVQRKDGTWTPPRHRCLHVFNEPDDKQRQRFKTSGFYMEQIVKDRARKEQRSVKLRIMMALYSQLAERVHNMVVGDGQGGVRPLDARNPVDVQYIFGTWQKNAMLPVFNNLTGVGGK